jgi:hypothetical protein
VKPGSYLVVPFEQPKPLRFLYEGGLPTSIGGPPGGSGAGAADIARFFCGLGPHG